MLYFIARESYPASIRLPRSRLAPLEASEVPPLAAPPRASAGFILYAVLVPSDKYYILCMSTNEDTAPEAQEALANTRASLLSTS